MPEPERIRIVTDSMAWIPDELAREHHIKVVPLHVHFGEETFTEGVDLSNQDFYRRLGEAQALPKTSQPSPGEFGAAFLEVAEGATAILAVHASAKLSGTIRSAEIAAAAVRTERAGLRIEVLDTQQIATAEGIVAIRAAEAAASGAAFDDVIIQARDLAAKPRILVCVETLEYLQRGGRIGRAQAFLGGLLHVRPILCVADGEVVPKERVRSRSRAIERFLDLMAEYAQGRPFGHVGVLHAEAADVGRELEQAVRSRFRIQRLIVTEIGPVIGTHVGPGAFAVTYHCD